MLGLLEEFVLKNIQQVFVVGVSGGSGSGKTTVVNLLKKELEEKKGQEVTVLSQDHYYDDLSHISFEKREKNNFDAPAAVDLGLLYSHIKQLSKGESISRPIYDFISHTRKEGQVEVYSKTILIFDGIFCLYDKRIRSLFDLCLYIQVEDDLRLIRRLQRDLNERGRSLTSIIQQYLSTVRPMHNKYIQPTAAHADFVINWDAYNYPAISKLADYISKEVLTQTAAKADSRS